MTVDIIALYKNNRAVPAFRLHRKGIPFNYSRSLYQTLHNYFHDYFFAKTLDKVRPGGLVAFITSKGTMDKASPEVRRYLAQRAELLGAVRLPENTFARSAGTEVTTDILFLQRRDHIIDADPAWAYLDDSTGITMNHYFVEHPDMVLGDMVLESGRYGMESVCKPRPGTNLGEALHRALAGLRPVYTERETEDPDEELDTSIPADPDVKNFSFTLMEGTIYYRQNSRMVPVTASATAQSRIKGLIGLRDTLRTLLDYQMDDVDDQLIQQQQGDLKGLRVSFRKALGQMYQTALDALIYPAEINTFNFGNFLDGHAQVEPGINPLGLLVRQLHHRSTELIAELLLLQDFFRGRWVLHNGLLNAIVAVQGVVSFVVIHLAQVACFRSFVGQEHLLHFVGYFQINVRLINIGIQLPKIDFLHYVPPFRFTGPVGE